MFRNHPGPQMCALSDSKRAHLRVPALQPPKFPRKHTEREKKTKWEREMERKSEILGPHPSEPHKVWSTETISIIDSDGLRPHETALRNGPRKKCGIVFITHALREIVTLKSTVSRNSSTRSFGNQATSCFPSSVIFCHVLQQLHDAQDGFTLFRPCTAPSARTWTKARNKDACLAKRPSHRRLR